MNILGLHISGSQSNAVVYNGSKVLCGAAEERFNSQKQSNAFPVNSIQYCMDFVGLKDIRDFAGVAVSWNPMKQMEQINMSGFTKWRRYDPEYIYITPNHLAAFLAGEIGAGSSSFSMDALNGHGAIQFVDHHLSHISQSAFQSPFKKCACLVADEYGEVNSFTFADVDGTKVSILKEVPFPHSLGSYYAMITEFLGFRPNSDEWKIMGAGAYGDPNAYYAKLMDLVLLDPETLDLQLDLRFFNHYNLKRGTYITPQFTEHITLEPLGPGDDLTQEYFDLAASMQRVFESVVFKLLTSLQNKTGNDNIVLGGGSFMNSLCNGKVLNNTPFSNIFIPYVTSDMGASVGAAMWVAHVLNDEPLSEKRCVPSPYLGPEFTDEELSQEIQKYKLSSSVLKDICKEVAQEIANGKIVGWFQGRMEFGERALGNRSILGDPRSIDMKDRINSSIKYRESFRPFAPSILAHKTQEYFEIPDSVIVPYMEQVYPIKKMMQNRVPAVTHNDGTGRLHMVREEQNPLYFLLISEYEKITGVPLIINTSFNLNGEPIVCTPKDAIRTFYSSGIDILVLGNHILRK